MESDELISRIDRHLERGNELAERNLRAFERHEEAFEHNSEVLNRAISTLDEQREFMREVTIRSERTHASLITEIRRGFAEIHEGFADQRRALLAILDRLPPATS